MPRSSRALCLDIPHQQYEHCSVRTGGWQGDLDARFELFDPHCDFQEDTADGLKSRLSEARAPWRRPAQQEQKPISAGMQKEPELVGLPAMTRRTVGPGIKLMLLDQIFHPSTDTMDLLIKMFASTRQIADDIAHIGALFGGFDASDDTPLPRPAFGTIADLEKSADFLAFANCAPHRHVFTPRMRTFLQPVIARQTEDIEAARLLQKIHNFRGSVMAVAAYGDLDHRPIALNAADDVAQDLCGFLARRPPTSRACLDAAESTPAFASLHHKYGSAESNSPRHGY